jgi:hypothetical protein
MSQQKLTHLFDGFAKVSAVHFHNNTAHFSAKFIRTKFFNDSTNCECIAPGVLVRIPLSVSGEACKLRPVSDYRGCRCRKRLHRETNNSSGTSKVATRASTVHRGLSTSRTLSAQADLARTRTLPAQATLP